MATDFAFIGEFIREISYPRFFHCVPLTDEEQRRIAAIPHLPVSYVDFLHQFGSARFFRELRRESHRLRVHPPPTHLNFYGDSYTITDIADTTLRGSLSSVSFKQSELAPGVEPPLYDIVLGITCSPRRRADSFMAWLTYAWDRCRKSYTKRDWARVLTGPEPFTPEQERIVEIRRGFRWKQLKSENERVRVHITNHSDGFLKKYTIGLRGRSANIAASMRFDVSQVAPGTSAVVERTMGGLSCICTAEEARLFERGEPTPERLEDFREFVA